MIDRSHEECAECRWEGAEPPVCYGHVAGPSPCRQKEKLDAVYPPQFAALVGASLKMLYAEKNCEQNDTPENRKKRFAAQVERQRAVEKVDTLSHGYIDD